MATKQTPSDGDSGIEPSEGNHPTASRTLPTSTADVTALASQLIDEQPEPQPHAIQQASDERAAAVESNTDEHGVQFDATQHTGTKTKDGHWRKKAGRKSGGDPASATGAGSANPGRAKPKLNIPGGDAKPRDVGAEAQIAQSRATGTAAANLFIMFSVGIGGSEWMPRDKPIDEKAMLEQGFADYFESQQWSDLPPWLGLVACIGMYSMPRFTMPVTKERAKGFRNWCASKYIGWRARRAEKAYRKKYGPRRSNEESEVEKADRISRENYGVESRQAGIAQ